MKKHLQNMHNKHDEKIILKSITIIYKDIVIRCIII